MSKAILIIDNPGCCEECEFCKHEMSFWWELIGGKCIRTKKDVSEAIFKETIDKNCPLKPMPKKIDREVTSLIDYVSSSNQYVCGRNDCIDEILGEKNE